MIALLNNKFFVIFLAPFILGVLTIFGFPPYNFTFVNFFTFSTLLFFIFLIKKRTFSTYRKKKSGRYFFYLGSSFGFGFFLFGLAFTTTFIVNKIWAWRRRCSVVHYNQGESEIYGATKPKLKIREGKERVGK